jgi:hypothetical protein
MGSSVEMRPWHCLHVNLRIQLRWRDGVGSLALVLAALGITVASPDMAKEGFGRNNSFGGGGTREGKPWSNRRVDAKT